jgi:hypothetical protein
VEKAPEKESQVFSSRGERAAFTFVIGAFALMAIGIIAAAVSTVLGSTAITLVILDAILVIGTAAAAVALAAGLWNALAGNPWRSR